MNFVKHLGLNLKFKRSRRQVFCKKGFHKNVSKLTGKHLEGPFSFSQYNVKTEEAKSERSAEMAHIFHVNKRHVLSFWWHRQSKRQPMQFMNKSKTKVLQNLNFNGLLL